MRREVLQLFLWKVSFLYCASLELSSYTHFYLWRVGLLVAETRGSKPAPFSSGKTCRKTQLSSLVVTANSILFLEPRVTFLYNPFAFPDNVLLVGGEFCYFIWTFILYWFLTYPVQVSMGWFDIIYTLRLLWRNCIRFKKQT